MAQINNAENIQLLTTWFRRRSEPLYAWADVVGAYSMLPHLRGLWLFSSISEVGDVFDASGQGRTLTDDNGLTYVVDPTLANVGVFDPANSDRLFRPTEPGLEITGGITFGGTFKFASLPAEDVRYSLVSKQGTVGNYGYSLYVETDNGETRIWFSISDDGTVLQVCSGPTLVVADVYYHVVARLDPGVRMATWVNGVEGQCDTGIPASIFNSTNDFEIGSDQNGNNYYDGVASCCFVCASTLPEYLIESMYWVSSSLWGIRDKP